MMMLMVSRMIPGELFYGPSFDNKANAETLIFAFTVVTT